MDLLKLGAQILMNKLGGSASSLSIDTIVPALKSLLPTDGGDLDIASIVSKMDGGGLASMAASFLGDDSNDTMSSSQVLSMLGGDKVSQFASQLGLGEQEAASGLSDMIPELIDKASSGGALKSIGSSVLGKLF